MNGGDISKYPIISESMILAPPMLPNMVNSNSNLTDYMSMRVSAVNSTSNDQQTASGGNIDSIDSQDVGLTLQQSTSNLVPVNIPNNNDQDIVGSKISLEHLKQMLSTQLEYYFSR
jgi:hypothetical protein